VAADQTAGGTQAPPFSGIAKKPGLDAGEIALFLLAPHPKMPDMNLSRAEAADLAAYIKAQ
jgi:mono/diheme cytochrome c family protein